MIRAPIRQLLLALPVCLAIAHAEAEEIITLHKCKLVAPEWADENRLLDLAAYAWHQPGPDGPAIDLAHDFQQVETLPENDRTHYTITPQTRKDLIYPQDRHTSNPPNAAERLLSIPLRN